MIREAIKAPRDLLANEWTTVVKVFTRDNYSHASPELRNHASAALEASVWNSLDLVDTLMTLAEFGDAREEVKPILDNGLRSNTELMFLGLAQLKTPWNALQQDLVSKLLHVYLTGSGVIPQFVQTRLWQVSQGLLVSGLLDLYDHDRSSLVKILKITNDLQVRK